MPLKNTLSSYESQIGSDFSSCQKTDARVETGKAGSVTGPTSGLFALVFKRHVTTFAGTAYSTRKSGFQRSQDRKILYVCSKQGDCFVAGPC